MNYEPDFDFDPHDFDPNFDFNTLINQILDAEVEKRIKQRMESYEEAIERDRQSFQQLNEFRRKYRDLERQLNQASSEFIKQGEDNARRQIFGGLTMGEKVWFVKKRYVSKKCETCNGLGNVSATFNGSEVKATCPDCRYGNISHYEFDPMEGEISEIQFHTWYRGKNTSFKFVVKHKYINGDDTTSFSDTASIFKTKEECDKKIEQLSEEQSKDAA